MNLLKKFAQFSVGNIIALILGILTYPVISRIINPTEMGKFSIFTTLISMIMLIATLGADQAYVRFFYEESDESRVSLFRKCIFFPILLCVLLCVLSIIFQVRLSNYLVGEYSIVCVLMVCIHIFGCVLERFVLLHVRMGQRANLYSLYSILIKVLYIVGVVIFYCGFGDNYLTLIVATVLSNMLVMLLAVYKDRAFYFSKISKKASNVPYRKIFSYSVPLIFSAIITWVFQSTDKLMLKSFSGYHQIGIYSGAMTLISMLNIVQTSFTTFWVPVAYEHYVKNPEKKEFFVLINKIISCVMLIAAVGLISCKDLIRLLLGSSYSESANVFPFLVFMPIMYTISETTVVGINFKEKTKLHIWIACGAASFNVIGNYFLVPILGAKGAAISTGLAYVVFFILRTALSMKCYHVSYQLNRFFVACVATYILAIASSFWKWSIWIFVLSMVTIVIICLSYLDVLKLGYEKLTNYMRAYKGHDK